MYDFSSCRYTTLSMWSLKTSWLNLKKVYCSKKSFTINSCRMANVAPDLFLSHPQTRPQMSRRGTYALLDSVLLAGFTELFVLALVQTSDGPSVTGQEEYFMAAELNKSNLSQEPKDQISEMRYCLCMCEEVDKHWVHSHFICSH